MHIHTYIHTCGTHTDMQAKQSHTTDLSLKMNVFNFGAGERTQCLRAFLAPTEDPSSVCSIHIVVSPFATPVLGEQILFLASVNIRTTFFYLIFKNNKIFFYYLTIS